MNHTVPQDLNIDEFLTLNASMTTAQLGAHYGRTSRTINYWLQALKEKGIIKNNNRSLSTPTPPLFPEPLGKEYNDFATIKTDRAIVLGDSEIPYHDPEIFQLAYSIAQRFDIKTLIINGDFLALDCFSTWAKQIVHKWAFEEELDPGERILETLLQQFDHIYYNQGNHELRLSHRVDGQMTIGKFLEKFAKVQFSEYAFCMLEHGTRQNPHAPSAPPEPNRTMVVHPKNYSRIPLATARELAAIHHCNILCGHNHHQAMGHDRSGRYFIMDGGCCRDPLHTSYKSLQVTTHPAWNPGFSMILNENPYLVNKSNAEFWKKVRID